MEENLPLRGAAVRTWWGKVFGGGWAGYLREEYYGGGQSRLQYCSDGMKKRDGRIKVGYASAAKQKVRTKRRRVPRRLGRDVDISRVFWGELLAELSSYSTLRAA